MTKIITPAGAPRVSVLSKEERQRARALHCPLQSSPPATGLLTSPHSGFAVALTRGVRCRCGQGLLSPEAGLSASFTAQSGKSSSFPALYSPGKAQPCPLPCTVQDGDLRQNPLVGGEGGARGGDVQAAPSPAASISPSGHSAAEVSPVGLWLLRLGFKARSRRDFSLLQPARSLPTSWPGVATGDRPLARLLARRSAGVTEPSGA